MKHFTTLLITIAAMVGKVHAQESVLTSGGNTAGTGGTVSYSVGQVAYEQVAGTNGYIIQGVQQPYEISTLTRYSALAESIECRIYPNPANDALLLEVDNLDLSKVSFDLVDMQGRRLKSGIVEQGQSRINVAQLANSTYFLVVSMDGESIKTFKIIKH